MLLARDKTAVKWDVDPLGFHSDTALRGTVAWGGSSVQN
jgi:hypothetical protein